MTASATDEETKAQLVRDFPGWSIIHTDRGNWWAIRLPEIDRATGWPAQHAVSEVEAVTADELGNRLRRLAMTDVEILRELGRALAEAGWRVEVRPHELPVRLRVVHPSLPETGKTVSMAASGAWFRSSTGAHMARCDDLQGAVDYLGRELDAVLRRATS
ncbi:hypothetical protein [Actinomadura rugatobispora]|uniref:Uncharacterized protein n=1 Tax=Actinomadura rugatobispora TaxID=1994 RepID=A0ABW1A0W3_9ACTN|nr:hypothetical protein GCM10010200_012020 [Actinomadura rugatobispora]